MGAQLAATVYVTDPDTHQQVRLEPGTCPEPRLAALVTAKKAWVDGKLPRLPKTQEAPGEGQDPPGDGPDDASGGTSGASGDADPQDTDKAAPAKKTAARKTAATKPARGRDAADVGDSSGE